MRYELARRVQPEPPQIDAISSGALEDTAGHDRSDPCRIRRMQKQDEALAGMHWNGAGSVIDEASDKGPWGGSPHCGLNLEGDLGAG